MDELMRSLLLQEIGRAERRVARAEQLLAGRVRQRQAAYAQLQQAQQDATEDRLMVARERAEARWERVVGERAA